MLASEELMSKRGTRQAKRRLPDSLGDLSDGDLHYLETSSKKWREKFEPHRDAIAESERITEADLKVRINTTTLD
jgi:hypothetical protein